MEAEMMINLQKNQTTENAGKNLHPIKEESTTTKQVPKEERREPALKRLPSILRRLGAVLLVAASFVFLFQRWDELNHLARYFSFLGFTGMMTGLGLICGVKMNDDRAARTLLGIVGLVVPIHFAQLGGYLYSVFREPFALGAAYPEYLTFVAGSPLEAALMIGAALLALIPMTFLMTSVFVRSCSKITACALLFGSALLLIPVRHPDLIGWITLAGMSASCLLDIRVLRTKKQIGTPEGKFVRALLFFPTIILMGRSLSLYNPSIILVASLLIGVALFLFLVLPTYMRKQDGNLIQALSLIPAVTASVLLSLEFIQIWNIASHGVMPTVTIPAAIVIFLYSRFAMNGHHEYRMLATLFLLSSLVLNGWYFPSLTNSLLAIVVSGAGVAYGYSLGSKSIFLFGVTGFSITLIHHIRVAIDLSFYNHWIGLAMVGLAAVFASSYLEKHRTQVKVRYQAFQARFSR